MVSYAQSLPKEGAASSRPIWNIQREDHVEKAGIRWLAGAAGRGSEGWKGEDGWANFQAAFFCWSTDPLAMDGEENWVDDEKLTYLGDATREYATENCASKGDEEREKCFLIRSTLRGFTLGIKHAREELLKCTYTSAGPQDTSCQNDMEKFVKGLVEEHYEKLNGLGYSPSS